MEHEERAFLHRYGLSDRATADERRRVYLPPVAVLWTSGGNTVEGAEQLLADRPVQASLHNRDVCVLKKEGQDASLLLDFGRELAGGVVLTVGALTGAESVQLRIRFGESACEAMSEIGGAGGATNNHACRDWQVTTDFLSTMTVGDTGFRFVRIDLLTPGTTMELCTVKAMLQYRDMPYLGSFLSSDDLLNQIWQTGAYTVHLNMQQYIWDGVKRDRLVWIGDLHPEISTITRVFGDNTLIPKSLDFVTDQTPADQWMNDFPSYSMWWVIIQRDYFLQFGNKAYLEKQLPYLKTLFANLSRYIDDCGRDSTPAERFVDWPTKGYPQAVDAGLQALHILAEEACGEIFRVFGEDALARRAMADCERMRAVSVHPDGFKQSTALALLAGLLDTEKASQALAQHGAEGMTSFMGYYVLQALAKAEKTTQALELIRNFWGGMLRLGATTFWEDFDIRWMENAAPIDRLPRNGEIDVHGTYGRHCYQGYRHSLCHGWASGPTAWLSDHVLGVEILEPGCRQVRIKPHLGDLTWVKGTYPTPYGCIAIEHRKQPDGTIQTSVQAPPEVTLEV